MQNKKKNSKWLIGLLVIFLVVLILIFGIYLQRNTIRSKEQAVQRLQVEAKKANVKDYWMTTNCLTYLSSDELDIRFYSIDIYEKHTGGCPGDPQTAPRTASFHVYKSGEKIEWYDVQKDTYIPFGIYVQQSALIQAYFQKFNTTTTWSRHGFTFTTDKYGLAVAQWRIYTWCSDNPTPPCDSLNGNIIKSGGEAQVVFSSFANDVANGYVISSNDSRIINKEDIQLKLLPYGMAQLIQGKIIITLCGTEFGKLAPKPLIEKSPCGA